MSSPSIAVVGATGLVGEQVLAVLHERDFPYQRLFALASETSVGQSVDWPGEPLTIGALDQFDFTKADLAFFCAGSGVAREYSPKAVAAGCLVIDNSRIFRQQPDVPLIVPEVNPAALAVCEKSGLIANPNCSTIQMVVAINPLHQAVGLQQLTVSTYQSVSGSGRAGLQALAAESAQLLSGQIDAIKPDTYPAQIGFNLIPHIDVFEENGYTAEEMKMVRETRKIFDAPDLPINPTAVRVPTFYGHAEAIHVRLREPISLDYARDLLRAAPGVVLLDDPSAKQPCYPTLVDVVGEEGVYVGRLRQEMAHPCGLNLWVVSDNIRKGAALNAVQIAELWLAKRSQAKPLRL